MASISLSATRYTANPISIDFDSITPDVVEDYYFVKSAQSSINNATGFHRKNGVTHELVISPYGTADNEFGENKNYRFSASDAEDGAQTDIQRSITRVDYSATTSDIGYNVNAPADTGERKLVIYGAFYVSNATHLDVTLEATLNDGSGTTATFALDTLSGVAAGSDNYFRAEITYTADSDSSTIDVSVRNTPSQGSTAAIATQCAGGYVTTATATTPQISTTTGEYTLTGVSVTDGVTPSHIFDMYTGGHVGYSLRKLKGDATNAIRVKNLTTTTQTDIGFDGEYIDEAALLSAAGGNSLSVVTWYDQSGNGNDLTAPNDDALIVSSGSIIYDTDATNGDKVAVQYTGSGNGMTKASIDFFNTNEAYQLFTVSTLTANNGWTSPFSGAGAGAFSIAYEATNTKLVVLKTGAANSPLSPELNTSLGRRDLNDTYSANGKDGSGNITVSTNINGGSNSTATLNYTGITWSGVNLAKPNNDQRFVGRIMEVIVFKADDTNRAAINANLYAYYKAEPVLEILLDTVTGAYALAGASARTLFDRVVSATTGVYAKTAAAATTLFNRIVQSTVGSYATMGVSADVIKLIKLITTTGAYTGSYQAITSLFDRVINAFAGAYAISGVNARINTIRELVTTVGEYAKSGINANMITINKIAAAAGNYVLSVFAVDVEAQRLMGIATGSYTQTGVTAEISQTHNAFVVDCAIGSYAIAGTTTTLEHSLPPPTTESVYIQMRRKGRR